RAAAALHEHPQTAPVFVFFDEQLVNLHRSRFGYVDHGTDSPRNRFPLYQQASCYTGRPTGPPDRRQQTHRTANPLSSLDMPLVNVEAPTRQELLAAA